MQAPVRASYLICCVMAVAVIIASLVVILTPVAVSNGLVPIPQPVPLSIEQIADVRKLEMIDQRSKRNAALMQKLSDRVEKYNKANLKLSVAKLERISEMEDRLEYLEYAVNELKNQLAEETKTLAYPGGRRAPFKR